MKITNGMNRSTLDRILRSLGGSVEPVRRTGEIAYHHPALAEHPRADARRKDATRRLTAFVRAAGQARSNPGSMSRRRAEVSNG